KAERAGMDFGRMAERIASRLVIFEAIRLAIQGIKYAFDQISNLQQARLQFDAMSDSTDYLAGRFAYLKEGADAAFTEIGKAIQVQQVLRDFGASEDQAAMATKDLDKWAQILGVDAVKLAEALGRVSQGEGSLQDMRLVTHMMGDQSAAGRALIQTYEDLVKEQKKLEQEDAALRESMDETLRDSEQRMEKEERTAHRHMRFAEKIAAAKVKGTKKTGEEELSEELSGGRAAAADVPGGEVMMMPRGGWRDRGLSPDIIAQYRAGIQQIAKEEGISVSEVNDLVKKKVLSYR